MSQNTIASERWKNSPKKTAYAIHGVVIIDRKGFPMVTDLGERLEVVRDGAREINQGPAKKAIRRHK